MKAHSDGLCNLLRDQFNACSLQWLQIKWQHKMLSKKQLDSVT